MAAPRGLHTLARFHGVQTAYTDNRGERIGASPESLMAALRALRVPLRNAADIPRLRDHRRRELWERTLEPVVVAWVGPGSRRRSSFRIRVPERLRDAAVTVRVRLEEGGDVESRLSAAELEVSERGEAGGDPFVALSAPLPEVPTGYHDLVVEITKGAVRREHRATLIAAPVRMVRWSDALGRLGGPDLRRSDRYWGVFAPLYALHEEDDPRPTFALLDRLADRVARHGGSVVGTLPLLAAFLDHPYEPSPYSPVSRLFWNEVYVDAEPSSGGAVADRLFDPRAAMAALRPELERRARDFFGGDAASDPPELEPFRARNPRADDYARFRALVEARGPWGGWPDRLRARDVRPDDYDPAVARYHLYVQWLAERQLAEATERAESRGVGLYLDLPLGVHPDGYDVWRERPLFALGASAGAPPDPLAAGGQNWGFPPAHPDAIRLDGHRYFVASIRKHLRFARVLRVDHVMQLHRMFWVPAGGEARDGVYVRYPADELFAILCLESHRAGAVVVGEDLGTVPRAVRRDMRRHGMPGMYVAQFELTETAEGAATAEDAEGPRPTPHARGGVGRGLELKPVPAGALASIGTHDTPTFAGWWWGRDIEIRRELGQMTAEEAEEELRGRGIMREKLSRGVAEEGESAETPGRVLDELTRAMGRSRAGLVLATLEDLWLEREPQNVPGTTAETNWRRRSRRSLAGVGAEDVVARMEALNQAREGNA